jgi:hypothetical protein
VSLKLRAGRLLTNRGGHGMDIKLQAMVSTNQVFWSRNHNSYVVVLQGSVNDGDPAYRVVSINGLGEVRWVLDPQESRWQCDNDAEAAFDYFFERTA